MKRGNISRRKEITREREKKKKRNAKQNEKILSERSNSHFTAG